jgi:hypothetical protein
MVTATKKPIANFWLPQSTIKKIQSYSLVTESNQFFFDWLKWRLDIGDQISGNYQFLGSDKNKIKL